MRTAVFNTALRLADSPVADRFLRLLERREGARSGSLRVLTYHRVDWPDARPELYPGLISATPDRFDRQMAFLAAHYRVVSMAEVLDAHETGTPLPARAVLITFDDASVDFAAHAWPVLKRYSLPATVFVPTAYPDDPARRFWWDRVYAAVQAAREPLGTPFGQLALTTPADRRAAVGRLFTYVKSLPHVEAMAWVEQFCGQAPTGEPAVLGWDALRTLAAEGVTLAAHTQTHPLMTRISPEEARREAAASRRDLEREIGPVLPVFAYPSGACDDAVARELQREGFRLAFTTLSGTNEWPTADGMQLRRYNVGPKTNLGILRARLLPWPGRLLQPQVAQV